MVGRDSDVVDSIVADDMAAGLGGLVRERRF